jgi:hypothetical protein
MGVGAWIRGLPAGVVQAIKGAFDYPSSVNLTIPGTATSFAVQFPLPRDFNVITTATGTFVGLPAGVDQTVSSITDSSGVVRTQVGVIEIGDTITVVNTTASALSVSGFTSAGNIQASASPYSQAAKTIADYRYIGLGAWMVNKSA